MIPCPTCPHCRVEMDYLDTTVIETSPADIYHTFQCPRCLCTQFEDITQEQWLELCRRDQEPLHLN